MARTAVQAQAEHGLVVLRVDPTTARDIAEAYAAWAAVGDERPTWHDDVVAVLTAAAHAELENGTARVVDPSGFEVVTIGRSAS